MTAGTELLRARDEYLLQRAGFDAQMQLARRRLDTMTLPLVLAQAHAREIDAARRSFTDGYRDLLRELRAVGLWPMRKET